MIKKYYALFDTKAQNFMNTIPFLNDAEAIRWFTTVVNNKEEKTNVSLYPEHFMLFHMYDMDDKSGIVGTWDTAKSELTPGNMPNQLILGISCVEEENKTFTVKELLTMLKTELHTDNVVEISKEAAKQ